MPSYFGRLALDASWVVLLVLSIDRLMESADPKASTNAPPTGLVSQLPKAIYDSQEVTQPRLSPEETVRTTKLPTGFHMNVAAKSPDVQQPIAMCWDSRGRLWVVENYTYAEKEMNFDESLSDRILIFEDTDGDGAFNSRKVFWDQGKKLTSIETGYGGVWALAPPHLLFIPDRDGDDVVDSQPQVILNGFEHQSIRHNLANGLRWGPDGWLYGRHGITSVSTVGEPGSSDLDRKNFSCSIWRWHPIRKKLDVVCQGTTNPWGFDWDKNGQLFFINTVIGHLWHAIPGSHLQRMFGDDLDSHVYELMPQIADHFHFDIGKEVWSDIRKLGVTPTTDALGGGHAHTGMMIYQGDQWPSSYRDKLFTLNFHGRRVNVERLDREGAGFVARHEPDMIHISDPWFRGIELSAGPDGSVLVLDWSDTGECHENDGVHRNSGTIYRVSYGSDNSKFAFTDLRKATDVELLNKIASSNEWLARQSRFIISERAAAGKLSIDVVHQLVQTTRSDWDNHRRQCALWTLMASGLDSPSILIPLLKDKDEHVRLYAVHALVDPSREAQDVTEAFLEMLDREKSDLVYLHLAGAMQKAHGKAWWSVMAALCQRTTLANDRDYPLMLWYAIKDRLATNPSESIQLLSTLYSGESANTPPLALSEEPAEIAFSKLAQFSARYFATRMERDPIAMSQLLAASTKGSTAMQVDVLKGIQVGLQGRHKVKSPLDWEAFAKKISQHPSPPVREALLSLQTLFGDGVAAEQLADIVRDKKASGEARRKALEVMTENRVENVKELAYGVIRDQALSRQAIETILRVGNVDDAKKIMAFYPENPIFRSGGIATLLSGLSSRREYLPVLFEAVEQGRLDPALVDASLLRQIQMLDDPAITEQLARWWPQTKLLGRERLTQILSVESQLTTEVLASASIGKGRAVWDKLCSSCHKLYGQGGLIGPELTGSQRTNLRYLTENILDPSATVAANYRISLVLLDDGTLVSGVVVAEDDALITVQTVKERMTIEKKSIEQRKPSTQSLMPEGLLDALDENARRDLFAYLMSSRQVDPD